MARRFVSLALVLGLVGCATGLDVGTDHIRERIVALDTDADGDTGVSFERSARRFVILREDAHLLAFAQQALAQQRPVHATVRAGHPAKTPAAAAQPLDAAGKRRIAVVALEWDTDAPAR